ncbi:glycoside hydrolase family protein [Novosphingobium sp.]|uniref:glycoside hydrolase family protein n=1 Tax=Novosphingobium sp. TaxID=1874826 RepID=UPI003B518378
MNRDLLEHELIADEGLKLRVYKDTVGKHTIGVGRNLDRVGGGLSEAEQKALHLTTQQLINGHSITQPQALLLLDNDIDEAVRQALREFPWWSRLSDPRQRALVNMVFNMGMHTLLTFTQTLAYLKAGEFALAAVNLAKSKWASQVGARSQRICDMIRVG